VPFSEGKGGLGVGRAGHDIEAGLVRDEGNHAGAHGGVVIDDQQRGHPMREDVVGTIPVP
jgi:hypothetical protein